MKPLLIRLWFGVVFSLFCSLVYAVGVFDAKSWRDVDVSEFNKIIIEAHNNKEEWVTKPEYYAHYLLGLGEAKEILYSLQANSMETPSEYTVKIKRQGLLDDSVSGDINILVLKRTGKGYWNVVSAKRASSCWRDKSKDFKSTPCP